MKILVVEDEKPLLDAIIRYFNKDKVICERAEDFDNGSEKIALYDYDCVILDLGLPDGHGLDLVKQLKEKEDDTGIIIISANGTLESKIDGLQIGADDYITKPFALSELNARVKAIIRRKQYRGKSLFKMNEIEVHIEERRVIILGEELKLTKIEYQLLLYLMRNKNRIITKNSIAEHLWGDHMDYADSYDFIYSHMKNLRKKLLASGCQDYIRTMYGVGYKMTEG
ncbi:MAG: response regulator transcription factor [Bacteroidia bacterium]|nr:response regulator transcription factor [Bacteroidia bacterium]